MHYMLFVRSALLNVLKVLKLLLVSSAYASIFQVVLELKQEEKSVSEERHTKAKQLQAALDQVIPSSEHKLKNVSINLAKLFPDKVSRVHESCWLNRSLARGVRNV